MDESPEQVAPAPELTAVEKGELAKQETARVKTNEQIRFMLGFKKILSCKYRKVVCMNFFFLKSFSELVAFF